MTMNAHARRWIAGLALAALTVTMAAPAAEARNKHGKHRGRSHHTRVVRHKVYRPVYQPVQRVVHVHRSSDTPAIAGFLGGLVLGAVLTSASQAHADEPRYHYYDPYCEERFGSLDIYRGHFRAHHHPRVVRVIEVSSGDCVETLRYDDGDWQRWDGRYDDRYDDYDD